MRTALAISLERVEERFEDVRFRTILWVIPKEGEKRGPIFDVCEARDAWTAIYYILDKIPEDNFYCAAVKMPDGRFEYPEEISVSEACEAAYAHEIHKEKLA